MTGARHLHSDRGNGRKRLSTVDSWLSLIGGGTLLAVGLQRGVSRRSALGYSLAAGGGALLYNGLRPRNRQSGAHVEVSYTINKPAEELYRYWRNFENLPKFMTHLESVRPTGTRGAHWEARGPLGRRFSWDTEITEERSNEYIVWRSVEGSLLKAAGAVQFRPAPGDRGTEVTVAIDYRPAGGSVSQFLAELLGPAPRRLLREELRHFKQLMEAGEIPSTEGQPHGARSTVVSMMEKATRRAHDQLAGARTA
jgi:uncharacterized membrane protein